MPGVALLLALAAGTLIYAGFKGYDPRSLVTSVFTGNPPTELAPLPGADSASGTVPDTGTGGPITGGRPPGAGGATPAAGRFWGALMNTFGPRINSVGNVSVRPIAGTNTLSQHAYGNALDISASPETMAQIWAWAISNAGVFSVRLVIYNRKQWTRSGIGPYTSTSNPHTDHVHVDFYPQYGGTPPGHPVGGG